MCGKKSYHKIEFQLDDTFLFGHETRGLLKEVIGQLPEENILHILMLNNIHSINLSNNVPIVVCEVWQYIHRTPKCEVIDNSKIEAFN